MTAFKSFILILCFFALIEAENLLSNGKVCDGVDARDDKQLRKLDGCQIIEGSVKIGPNDKFDPGNVTFPLVTEIAGYLMIYNLAGLKSVAQLFPNLAAIRGGELFKDYAMVLFRNPDLEDIGLKHLKGISHGAVRIEKNERLCYVNTVDWSVIMSNETYGKNVFEGNVEAKFCPKCGNGIENCWSSKSSQLVECECGGNSCNANATCCEPSCLSCLDDDKKACTVCRQFIAGIYPSQKCVETCPYRTYEYLNHRCITDSECRNLNINKMSDVPYIPFQGICKVGCPQDFQIKYAVNGNKMSASCSPCVGKECWRKCKSVVVDSVAAAETLKGCQVIDGPLEIQMKSKLGVDVEQVLIDSLSGIVEIEDYLKISRSFPIITLKFLKNLRKIKGTKLEKDKYSIVVWDNENLEKLFEDDQKVEIESGKLFIHFNPKLCFDNVERLSKSTQQTIENLENAQFSNGDKAFCNATKLETELIEVFSESARIKWKPLKLENDQDILEYVIFFIEAPEQNVDLWSSRGPYGTDGWTAIDVEDFSSNIESISYTLPLLKAFTQYAYYVKAYTSSKSHAGAQSEINYFKTLPDKPETVESVMALTKSDSEIILTWKTPKNINGELERYEIEIKKLEVMRDFLKQRDFCEHPFDTSELKQEEHIIENSTAVEPNKNAQTTLDFEGEIQDLLHSRNKRSSFLECPQESPKAETENLFRLEIVGADDKEFVINALSHYSSYAISIRACRKEDKRIDEHTTDGLCSDDTQVVAKTSESDTADNIQDFEVSVLPSNTSENHVKLTWIPPKNPNGKILGYEVKMKRMDHDKSTDELICISLLNRENACSQVIDKINPGNYSFQMMALTLAGSGNFSTPKFLYIKSVSHFSLIASPAFMALFFLIVASVIAAFVFIVYKRNQQPEVVSRFENFDYEDHPMNNA